MSDLTRFGDLLNQSHSSLRDDYEVSCPELDTIVECAKEVNGLFGARLTGAGFGGCAIAVVRPDSVQDVIDVVSNKYKTAYQTTVSALTTQPAPHASLI